MMKHLVLVHGAGHGAWCWYKVVTLLRSAGHRVSAVDLGGSGINPNRMDEMGSIIDYLQPLTELMASIPKEERVILVAHSLGGFAASLATEQFPEKISVAVFLTALMPNHTSPPASLLQELAERLPTDFWSDTKHSFDLDPVKPKPILIFGPKSLATTLYQLSSSQDLALAELLVRPACLFREDLSKGKAFSEVGYGSVNRVYIVCKNDLTIPEDHQRWMIENNPVKEVMEIEDSDHMPMISKPNEVCGCLLDIANKYN